MPGYSIFADTIADMAWPAVEEAGRRHALMLVPVAVIEEHGPHLPLATDTYGATLLCTQVRTQLVELGIEAVVAPPFYLGMNCTTRMFPGSLDISRETMTVALAECLRNYASWGFTRQFVLNHHGAPQHNAAIIDVIRTVRVEGVDAVFTMGGFTRMFIEGAYLSYYKQPLPLSREALLVAEESEETKRARLALTKAEPGVHAEERETSLIMRWFPETLTDPAAIPALPPVVPTPEQFDAAVENDGWRELSPLGYIGTPAVATPENGELYRMEANDMARAIASHGSARDMPAPSGGATAPAPEPSCAAGGSGAAPGAWCVALPPDRPPRADLLLYDDVTAAVVEAPAESGPVAWASAAMPADIESQAYAALENLMSLLAKAGKAARDLVAVRFRVSDAAGEETVRRVCSEYLGGSGAVLSVEEHQRPSLDPRCLVAISALAVSR